MFQRKTVLLCVSFAVFAGCEPPATDAPEGTAPSTASPAAAFEIQAVTPEKLQELVAANRGKVVLVDFWATWCVPCVKQYPHTLELSERHLTDLVVYTVSMDETDEDSLAAVKKFHSDQGLGQIQPLISAEGGAEEAYTAFEITGGALPHYKVYDREGKLVAALGGDVEASVEPEHVDAAVAQALAK